MHVLSTLNELKLNGVIGKEGKKSNGGKNNLFTDCSILFMYQTCTLRVKLMSKDVNNGSRVSVFGELPFVGQGE